MALVKHQMSGDLSGEVYWLAKMQEQQGKDIARIVSVKDKNGKVLFGPYQIKRRWEEYVQALMNDGAAEGDDWRGGPVERVREIHQALRLVKLKRAVALASLQKCAR